MKCSYLSREKSGPVTSRYPPESIPSDGPSQRSRFAIGKSEPAKDCMISGCLSSFSRQKIILLEKVSSAPDRSSEELYISRSNVDHVLRQSVRFKCLPKILESCGKKNIYIYYIHNYRNSPVRNAPIWFLLRDHPAKSAKKNVQPPRSSQWVLQRTCPSPRAVGQKEPPSCGRFDVSNAKQAHLKFLQKGNGF